ncbi:MAG: tRNA glutamyl-Q(34) synthetase GluQRS, partial [Chromatiaceae bacterium]|nr:tRNA glutamyl-Q(34) synthetase GluQRS [Chromatiaceae bacterium]
MERPATRTVKASPDELAPCRGRFAPSPTGPLHFGSLVAALGSFLDARAAGGQWLVRIENLDPPREIPGAADAILSTLDALGFEWDGKVLHQSSRTHAYAEAIEQLQSAGLVFPCACSRREIAASGPPGADGAVYPGTCRQRMPPGRRARSLRLRTDCVPILV